MSWGFVYVSLKSDVYKRHQPNQSSQYSSTLDTQPHHITIQWTFLAHGPTVPGHISLITSSWVDTSVLFKPTCALVWYRRKIGIVQLLGEPVSVSFSKYIDGIWMYRGCFYLRVKFFLLHIVENRSTSVIEIRHRRVRHGVRTGFQLPGFQTLQKRPTLAWSAVVAA